MEKTTATTARSVHTRRSGLRPDLESVCFSVHSSRLYATQWVEADADTAEVKRLISHREKVKKRFDRAGIGMFLRVPSVMSIARINHNVAFGYLKSCCSQSNSLIIIIKIKFVANRSCRRWLPLWT